MNAKMKANADSENGIRTSPSIVEGQASTFPPPRSTTRRGLKSRHGQMIALGGTIGTGLFVGSGQSLHIGGPVFLVVAYFILAVLMFGIVTATTEMSSYLPVPGSSIAFYANRFHSTSLGFALGWMHWYVFCITVPGEITAAMIVIDFWKLPVPVAVWLTVFLVLIVGLNCFPVEVYGETEFWFASLKVFGIVGLLIMAIVLIFGGGPNHQLLGFHYWKHPGPVNEYLVSGNSGRLSAFISTICFSMFAFAFAPELLVVTGGEMKSPRRNLPLAGKRYFYRLALFYVLGALAISLIIPSNDSQLLDAQSGAGVSPWAVAARNAGIKGLDSVINAIILASALSAGNSCLYFSSRVLYSMATIGNAPQIFLRCTKSGIPYLAVTCSALFSLLAYLNVSSKGATVFNWFANLVNAGGFTSWICVCTIYLRFRKATMVQGVSNLPFRSRLQPSMAYICGIIFTMLLLLNGFANFLQGQWNTSNFVTAYIGIPIFLALYLSHRFVAAGSETWVRSPEEVDLISGLEEILRNETLVSASGSKKWYQKWKFIYE